MERDRGHLINRLICRPLAGGNGWYDAFGVFNFSDSIHMAPVRNTRTTRGCAVSRWWQRILCCIE